MPIHRCLAPILVFLAALLPLNGAVAGEFNLLVNGVSHHVNASRDWNEDNAGLGFEYHFDTDTRWRRTVMANGFRDSNEHMTYMAGAGLHRRLLETRALAGLYMDVGINAFVMTRKDVNDNRPFLGALPSVSFGNRRVGFNLTYLPEIAVKKILDAEMADPTLSGIFFVQFKLALTSRPD